jgi:N4-gp56 family major capsid protein
MASSITVGAADVSLWTTFILKKLIPGLKAELVFGDYAEPAQMPSKFGAYVARWLVPTMRVGTVTPLTDGTSGALVNMVTISRVEATIADYGEHFQITDLARESEIEQALDSYKDIVMYAGASSTDTLIYNAVCGLGTQQSSIGTTNFFHAGDSTIGGTSLIAGDVLKLRDFPRIGAFFRARNAKGWDKLSKDYMLAIHPDTESFLVSDVTTGALSWSEANKHVPAGFEQLINNHRFVGRFNGISCLRTTIIGTATEGVLTHRCVALARYGVGWLGLGETGPKAPEIKIKSPGPQSTNDPLDTVHTLGWKQRGVARMLDASRALVVYSATA